MDELLHNVDLQEWGALFFFIVCWVGYARYTEHSSNSQNNLLAVTNRYRLQWMREMMRRDNRSVDAIISGNPQRSIAFFANTTIFLVLGLITMLGYHDRANAILETIPFSKPANNFVWEIKITMLIVMFIYAFFKCTWSMRQYNYAAIFIAAAPPHNERIGEHESIAQRGSFLVGNAAKHFNDGLRAYYFGLAALGWFIHPTLFMAATALVVYILYRREYRSATLHNLTR